MSESFLCPHCSGPRTPAGPSAAIFLDRDGVLIEDTGYADDPDAIELLPGVAEALRLFRDAGFRLIVASNQAGVAHGLFSVERVFEMHQRLEALLAAEGVSLDALYFCPHRTTGKVVEFSIECEFRKPGAGMLRDAIGAFSLEPQRCWMIGDRQSDVEAGIAAGCHTILIGAGPTAAAVRAGDLLEAAHLILWPPV